MKHAAIANITTYTPASGRCGAQRSKPVPQEITSATNLNESQGQTMSQQPDPIETTEQPAWERIIEILTDLRNVEDDDASVISALDQLIIDAKARDEFGRKKYGTPLQPGNGRDHLRDWWEECMDGIAYAYCALHEAAGSRQYAEYEADLTELFEQAIDLLIGLSQLRLMTQRSVH